MWKVLLVDDDVPMIKYWSKRLPWKSVGLEVAGLAHSGEKALQLFRKTLPDVLITDIGMPQMDGLELAAKIKAMKPDIRIIFLTCHEEFEYARRAVQLNADNYLIKDEMTEEQMVETLELAVGRLKENRSREGERFYLRDIIKDRELMKQRFFHQLLSARHPEEMTAYAGRLGIRWDGPRFIMALGFIRFDGFPHRYRCGDLSLLLFGICNIADDLRTDAFSVDTLRNDDALVVCIANFRPNLSRNPQQSFRDFLAELEAKTMQYLNVGLIFGNIAVFEGSGNVAAQYDQLQQEHKRSFYNKNKSDKPAAKEQALFSPDVTTVLGSDWSKVRTAFIRKDREETIRALESMKCEARKLGLDPDLFNEKCSQWIRVLELDADQPGDEQFHQCLILSKRLDDTMALLQRKIFELADRGQSGEAGKSSKLQQIERYLSGHMSRNISLADLAGHMHLNPSYLSRYFKNETGMNFTDYVHRYKMKAACRMLKQKQYNVETIAINLGYTERTYFSKLFKKYIGVNPKDYR